MVTKGLCFDYQHSKQTLYYLLLCLGLPTPRPALLSSPRDAEHPKTCPLVPDSSPSLSSKAVTVASYQLHLAQDLPKLYWIRIKSLKHTKQRTPSSSFSLLSLEQRKALRTWLTKHGLKNKEAAGHWH